MNRRVISLVELRSNLSPSGLFLFQLHPEKDSTMTNNSLNNYGVPLHACNGYKQDEHYWSYIGEKNRIDKINGVGLYDPSRLWVNIKAKELGIV